MKSNHQLLIGLGFKSELHCPYCGDYVASEQVACCGEVGRQNRLYLQAGGEVWLTEDEALERASAENNNGV